MSNVQINIYLLL